MHPFLQFPELFFLSAFLVPVFLRVTVALSVGYIAYAHYRRRSEVSTLRVPIFGKIGGLIWAAIAVEAALALMLLFGYYTQVAALLTAILFIKHAIFAKKYARAIPLCRLDYVYLCVMCLALIFMGAGAFAMDLPL